MRVDINNPNINMRFIISFRDIGVKKNVKYTITYHKNRLTGSGFFIEKSIMNDDILSFGGIESGRISLELEDAEPAGNDFSRFVEFDTLTVQIYERGKEDYYTIANEYRIIESIKLAEGRYKFTAIQDFKKWDIKGNALEMYNSMSTSEQEGIFLKAFNRDPVVNGLKQRDSSDTFYYDQDYNEGISIPDLDISMKDYLDSSMLKDKSYYNLIQDYLELNYCFGVFIYDDISKNFSLKKKWFPIKNLNSTVKFLKDYLQLYYKDWQIKNTKNVILQSRATTTIASSKTYSDTITVNGDVTRTLANVHICPDIYSSNVETQNPILGGIKVQCNKKIQGYDLYSVAQGDKNAEIKPEDAKKNTIIAIKNNIFYQYWAKKAYHMDKSNYYTQWVTEDLCYHPGTVTIPSDLNIKIGDAVIILNYNESANSVDFYPMLVGKVSHSTNGTTKIHSPRPFIYMRDEIKYGTLLQQISKAN